MQFKGQVIYEYHRHWIDNLIKLDFIIPYIIIEIKIIGKEEYAEIVCEEGSDSSCNRTLNRPHLLGVGSPLGETLKHVNNTGNDISEAQSLSHNVGIWVWGAYQVW